MLEIAIPGAAATSVAIALSMALRFLLPKGPARRDALPIGLLGGFLVGYILLPDWAPLQPQRYWHWIPYIAVIAACVGPMYLASGVHPVERCVMQIIVCAVAAYLLTPSWQSLAPPRSIMIPCLGAYLFLLCAAVEPLGSRLPSLFFMATLSVVAFVAMVLVSYECSLKIGEVLLIGVAAVVGSTLACIFVQTFDVRANVLVYVVIVAGLTFVAQLEPEVPPRALLVIPAAPIVMWLGEFSWIARLKPAAKIGIQAGLVAVVLGLAAALLLWRDVA